MRVFNALNGEELKQLLLRDVQRVLSQDSELQRHLTFPKVSWTITVDLKIYPRTPADKQIVVLGGIEQVTLPGGAPVDTLPERGEPVPTGDPLSETLTNESPEIGEHVGPDALREEAGIPTASAPPQITWARRVEVGTGAKHPAPPLVGNRDRG
jgi:hypothetical protein